MALSTLLRAGAADKTKCAHQVALHLVLAHFVTQNGQLLLGQLLGALVVNVLCTAPASGHNWCSQAKGQPRQRAPSPAGWPSPWWAQCRRCTCGQGAGQLVWRRRRGSLHFWGRTSTQSPAASGWGSPRQPHARRARPVCRGSGRKLVTPGRRAPATRPPGGPKPQGFARQPRHPSGADPSRRGQASRRARLGQAPRTRQEALTHLRGRGRRRCGNKASPLAQPLGGRQLHRPRPRAAGHRCGHGTLRSGTECALAKGRGLGFAAPATSRKKSGCPRRTTHPTRGVDHGACPGMATAPAQTEEEGCGRGLEPSEHSSFLQG